MSVSDAGPITVFDELPSTNAELLARGRAGAPHGASIRARVQTAGRGQRAHTWASPEGGLYLSVLVRPRVPADLLPGLPVACALGILRAVHLCGCHEAKLKWPNDVVVGGRKLAGILLELGTSPEGVFAVCGVGVNMRTPQLETTLAAGAGGAGATPLEPIGLADLLAPDDPALDIDVLAESICEEVLDAVAIWQDGIDEAAGTVAPTVSAGVAGTAQEAGASVPTSPIAPAGHREAIGTGNRPVFPLYGLQEAYCHVLAYRGAPVRVFAIDGEIVGEGIFAGVDGYGHALVLNEQGEATSYDAACVSIRPR